MRYLLCHARRTTPASKLLPTPHPTPNPPTPLPHPPAHSRRQLSPAAACALG